MAEHKSRKPKVDPETEHAENADTDNPSSKIPEVPQHEIKHKETTGSASKDLSTVVQDISLSNQQIITEAQSSMAPRTSLGPLSAAEASPADITDELEKGGPALGSFVKAVGLAIAEGQKALDDNLVNVAKSLSETKIDVIAVFEQQIRDDDGMMELSEDPKKGIHIQKLPLINYLMPTAYHWSRVYLEADMKVKEFNGANGLNIKGKSTSFSAGASTKVSLYNPSANINVGFSTSDYEQNIESSFARDEAVGSLHLEATLEPREDIQLPKPFVVQKGPRLVLNIGTREDLDKAGNPTADPTKVEGRRITIIAELKKSNGEPNQDKTLEISVDPPALNYTGSGQTGADGKFMVTVARTGAAFDKKTFVNATVRVWFGLVSEMRVVTL